MANFNRPVGPAVDVKELEYISALHQSTKRLRIDGSIKAIDVVHFLTSRYGIVTTEEEVRKYILAGLGGGNGEEDCIDITEAVAILLIPFLLKQLPNSMSKPIEHQDLTQEQDQEVIITDTWTQKKTIGDVLKMILFDTTQSMSSQKLDKDLVKRILLQYDESEMAEDEDLVEEMVLAANDGLSSSDGCNVELNADSFLRAMTHDVEKYCIENETKATTTYFDVFQTNFSTSSGEYAEEKNRKAGENRFDDNNTLDDKDIVPVRPVKKIYTAPQIDNSVCLYRSKLFTVLLWAFLLMTTFAYLPNPTNPDDWLNCVDYSEQYLYNGEHSSFTCKVGNRLIHWFLLGVSLCLAGTLFIFIGSMGNSIHGYSKRDLIFSMMSMACIAIVPFILTRPVAPLNDGGGDGAEKEQDYEGQEISEFRRWPALALGCLVVLMQALQLGHLYYPGKFNSTVLTHGNLVSECNLKQAAACKVNTMVENAMKLHDYTGEAMDFFDKTFYDRALLRFEKKGTFYAEKCGGFLWTWKKIFSGDLFKKEGVWLSSRIIVGNVVQFIVALLVLGFGITETDRNVWFLNDDFSNEIVLDSLQRAGRIGSILGFMASIVLSALCIPSYSATTLQFRSGSIASLHDRNFKKNRTSPDSVSSLLGSMLWGVFFSGVGIFVVFGGVAFLIMYPETRDFVTNIVASLIGFTITLLIKLLILQLSRLAFYRALYRTDPAKANFMVLALECWNVGLGAGFMFIRIIKLIVVAIFYVGRVDAPILGPEVDKLGPIELDRISTIFRRDIVLHEAHRHPYLETLGVMYMMKLRHGESFGNRAGSCWRLIFVFALMPWLRVYRILTKRGPATEEDDIYVTGMDNDGVVVETSPGNTSLVAENARLKEQFEALSFGGGNLYSVHTGLLEENARLKEQVQLLSSRNLMPLADLEILMPSQTMSE